MNMPFPGREQVEAIRKNYPSGTRVMLNNIGNKTNLLPIILSVFPREFGRYIEIFGGSGAVLLGKEPSKFEVYNDIEGELVNFFRVVKNRPAELLLELDLLPLNSREEFASWLHFHDGGNEPTIHLPDQLEIIDRTTPASLMEEAEKLKTSLRKRSDYRDVRQAAAYLMRVRNSYSSSGRSFACQPFSVRTLFTQIWEMSRRLENVIIEQQSFEVLIPHYDREDSFFYGDPPYYDSEYVYDAEFGWDHHVLLRDTLAKCKGKWLVSQVDCQEIRYLFREYQILDFNTILSYRDTFSLFLRFCKEQRGISPERLSFQQMDRTLVEDFLNWLETDRNCSISTRNQRLAALRAFFRYLQIHHPEQLLLCQQMIQIPSKKAQEKAMGYLSLEGLKLLLSIPDTSSRQGRRDLVLLSLLYDTGARVQEIVDLCYVDVRAQFPATVRLSGKGGKVRIVPLSTDMSKLLRSYMEEQAKYGQTKETYPLFTNRSGEKMTRAGVAYILKKYMDAARSSSPGILPERFSPHCLRHSKAMHLLQAGVNLVYIRDLLGHTDLRTTEIYARAETKAKREALEAASPIKSESQFPSWTDDNSLISWLQSFGHSNS